MVQLSLSGVPYSKYCTSPWGNTLLTIGMGTEVLMFIITAFERPEKEYHWEDVFPILDSGDPDDRPDFAGGSGGNITINGDISGAERRRGCHGSAHTAATPGTEYTSALPGRWGATVVASPEVASAIATMSQEEVKAVMGLPQGLQLTDEETQSLSESIAKMNNASNQLSRMAELTDATQQYLSQMATISEQMQR